MLMNRHLRGASEPPYCTNCYGTEHTALYCQFDHDDFDQAEQEVDG